MIGFLNTMTARFGVRRFGILAVAAGSLLAAGSLIGSWENSPGFQVGGTLLADDQAGLVLDAPVHLLDAPAIAIEQAAIRAKDGDSARPLPDRLASSRRLLLDRPVIAIDVAGRGLDRSATVDAIAAAIGQRVAALDLDTLTIRGGTLRLIKQDAAVELLTDVEAELAFPRGRPVSVAAEVTYRGQRLKLAGSVGRPAPGTVARRWPVQIAIVSPVLNGRVDGAIAEEKGLRLSGAADLTVPSVRSLANWLTVDLPTALQLKTARLKGQLDWHAGSLTFADAALSLDASEATGTLTLGRSKMRASVSGTLAFKTLDLAPHILAAASDATGLAAMLRRDARAPSPRDWLGALDVDLRISTHELRLPVLTTGPAAVALTINDERLLADIAELTVEGGVFRGQMGAKPIGRTTRYTINGKLEGVEPGRILMGPLAHNPLSGRADITMALTSEGDSLDAVLAELSGDAQLVMNHGGRLGLDLRALLQSLKQNAERRGWLPVGSGGTGLDELRVGLRVVRGVVHAKILEAKSGSLAILGSGYVDLAGRALDMALRFGTAERWGKTFDATEVLVLTGPWRAPLMALERTGPRAPR